MRKPMAFPYEGSGEKQPGMTLRDWYAGMALQGMLAHSTRYRCRPHLPAGTHWHFAIAEEAFQIADAMIAAREKCND